MRSAIRRQWFLGLDLGQSRDCTAMVMVERAEVAGEWDAGWYAYAKEAELRVVHAERAPLGTPYPSVVERVRYLTGELEPCYVAVDGTGVGRPVVDLLRGGGRRLMPVTITGGQAEGMQKGYYTVPKKDLIGGLTTLLEGRQLKIAKGMAAGGALRDELMGMQVKMQEGGGEKVEGEKDDLVIALALGCWAGRKMFGAKLTGRSGWCTREGVLEVRGRIV